MWTGTARCHVIGMLDDVEAMMNWEEMLSEKHVYKRSAVPVRVERSLTGSIS